MKKNEKKRVNIMLSEKHRNILKKLSGQTLRSMSDLIALAIDSKYEDPIFALKTERKIHMVKVDGLTQKIARLEQYAKDKEKGIM